MKTVVVVFATAVPVLAALLLGCGGRSASPPGDAGVDDDTCSWPPVSYPDAGAPCAEHHCMNVAFAASLTRNQVQAYVDGLPGTVVIMFGPDNFTMVGVPLSMCMSEAQGYFEGLGPSVVQFVTVDQKMQLYGGG